MKKYKIIKEFNIGDIIRVYDNQTDSYRLATIMNICESNIIGMKRCILKNHENKLIKKNISFNSTIKQFNAMPTFNDIYCINFSINNIKSNLNETTGYLSVNLSPYLDKEIKLLKRNTYHFINMDIYLSILNEMIQGNIEVYDGSVFSLNVYNLYGLTTKFNFIIIKNYCELLKQEVFEIMNYNELKYI